MTRSSMTTIVVSGVNIRKGGTLTIMRQCLGYLSSLATVGGYRIVALVHRRELADYPHIEYIELPWSIEGWGKRLWCEYITMGRIAKQIGDIDLWLSLHDTTPRVKARRQAVYCQTSFPFYKWQWGDFRFDPKIPLFAMFTRFAYQLGIQRNEYLIVQQSWLREGFAHMFGIDEAKFIVAPVAVSSAPSVATLPSSSTTSSGLYTFFFASTADSHKNFETLCRATALLEERVGKGLFRTIITVAGSENKYAQWLHNSWGHVQSLVFHGLMDKATLYEHYEQADTFVFPSRIETWGLPITEYMHTKGAEAQLLLADLPYAHETAGGADRVAYFPATDAEALAQLMKQALEHDGRIFSPQAPISIQPPYARDWEGLFGLLLNGIN